MPPAARAAAEEILRIIYGDDLAGCTVSHSAWQRTSPRNLARRFQFATLASQEHRAHDPQVVSRRDRGIDHHDHRQPRQRIHAAGGEHAVQHLQGIKRHHHQQQVDDRALRRLQVAAESGRALGFAFRDARAARCNDLDEFRRHLS